MPPSDKKFCRAGVLLCQKRRPPVTRPAPGRYAVRDPQDPCVERDLEKGRKITAAAPSPYARNPALNGLSENSQVVMIASIRQARSITGDGT